ncbi:MAG: GNAT family N-acetyltransferase [Alphaproteobacteria bacterium]|nr:GNAT family N-acetyltransferase [Alphaproteobacteria bacterium]HPF46161.1 GNAT family N-acetyltransferase [Emcibacteraceae bacterium]HRW28629.1 GNAT family N-acetyltransferase [Emcibacteraceae bacterium]
MSIHWVTRNIGLPFWVGEICLFRKSFRLKAANIDFPNILPEDVQKIIPRHPIDDTDGFMLYSAPMNESHKILWKNDAYIFYVQQSFHRYFITLDEDYEEYMQQFSSKTRSTFRRKVRKFEEESGGTIDWRIYRSQEEMKEFHKIARDISKETYQEKLLNAGLPDDEGFYKHMMQHAERGTAFGFLLYLNGEAVSYLYSPIYDGRMIYDHLGYLPEHSKLSPGIVLFLLVLEYLFETKPNPIFDFTEGQSEQKKQFSTNSIYCANLFCIENKFSNYFWLWLNNAINHLSENVASFLDKIGLKDSIKKLLRR